MTPTEITEKQLKIEDAWGLFVVNTIDGLRALPFLSDPGSGTGTVEERVLPEKWVNKAKRHLILPDPEKFSFSAGITHLLILEGGEEVEDVIPTYIQNLRVDGPFIVVWHNAETGKDLFIHCPVCLSNVAAFLAQNQEEWAAAFNSIQYEGQTFATTSQARN